MSKRLILALAAVLMVRGAIAQGTGKVSCTPATLSGAYGFIHDGLVFATSTHMAEVGIARFDGNGHWAHDAMLMSNGELRKIKTSDGTYTVKSDCTGSGELRGSQVFTFDFVILNGGREVMQIATRPDRNVIWDMARQEVERCSAATIMGPFVVRQDGFDLKGNPKAGIGVATFNGKGAWLLTMTEVNQGEPVQHIDAKGSYIVNSDCTVSASLMGTPLGTVDWALVVVRSGAEIFGIATTPPRGAVTWVLNRQIPR